MIKRGTISELVRGSISTSAITQHTDATTQLGGMDADQLVARASTQWAWRCCSLNASVAAGIPPRLFAIDNAEGDMARHFGGTQLKAEDNRFLTGKMSLSPGGEAKALIRGNINLLVEIKRHPLLQLLNNPNHYHGGFSFREGLFFDLNATGRSFTMLTGKTNAPPSGMWRMLTYMTKVVPSQLEFIDSFLYGRHGQQTTLAPEEVIWIRLYDPRNLYGGLGPTEAFAQSVDSSIEMTQYQRWLLQRGGAPDYLVQTDKPLDEEQKKSFIAAWKRKFSRLFSRTDNVAFLEGEGKIERLGLAPKELEFTESSKDLRDQIGIAYGIPKSVLTTDDVNLANAKVGQEQHMRNGVWPLLQRVEDAWNNQLVPMWSDRLVLCFDNPIAEDSEAQLRANESHLATGWTVNEVREENGMPALDEEEAELGMVASTAKPLEVPEPPPMAAPGAAPGEPAEQPTEDSDDAD